MPGHRYFITTVCHRRQRFFASWPVASAVCRTFSEGRLWRDSMLLCWVLMPDHLHMLVELGHDEPLDALVRRVKAVTSKEAKSAAGRIDGQTWAPGFHERLMRGGLNLEAVARYIVANPVRAGLVRSCRDYPYWDAIWLDRLVAASAAPTRQVRSPAMG